jgi:DNA-binding winged helix-turn-helix (wHTH) protein
VRRRGDDGSRLRFPAMAAPAILSFGVFEVDLRACELRKQGVRVKLQDQPFQVLTLLLKRPGEVISREELRSQLWGSDTFIDFDNGLNTLINKLREALGDSADSPRFIETLPRRGYRFIAPLDSCQRRVATVPSRSYRANWLVMALVCMGSLAIAGCSYFRRVPKATDKDTHKAAHGFHPDCWI